VPACRIAAAVRLRVVLRKTKRREREEKGKGEKGRSFHRNIDLGPRLSIHLCLRGEKIKRKKKKGETGSGRSLAGVLR